MKSKDILGDLMEALSAHYKIKTLDEDMYFAEHHNNGNEPEDMLWPVVDNEYNFIYGMPSLSDEDLNNILADSLEDGLTHVRPGPDHRLSIINTIIVSDKADGKYETKIKNYHFIKNYRLSIHGSAEHGVILVDASKKKLFTNRTAKKVAEQLRLMYGLS